MTPIQKHMLLMFINLRRGVGIVGIALPVVLGVWGYAFHKISLSGSMSAYYHATEECSGQTAANSLYAAKNGNPAGIAPACVATGTGPMRNWFVGNLFFFGGAMLLMRGFSQLENWALNIAGLMAPCVALFPMNWGVKTSFTPHLTFAITFFVCVGFTCVFCSGKTLKQMPDTVPNREKVIAFYKRWYRVFAVIMVAAPACAHLFLRKDPNEMFFVEAAGVWAFGFYWLFKTYELKRSDIEYRLMRGDRLEGF
ncbi:MAG: hypothetical protein WAL34_03830 [Acidobacteriaceae bacterium]